MIHDSIFTLTSSPFQIHCDSSDSMRRPGTTELPDPKRPKNSCASTPMIATNSTNADEVHMERRARFQADGKFAIVAKLESSSTILTLNVGGKQFTTRRTTLTRGRASESMFSAMFSGRWSVMVDGDGCVFIDHNPHKFQKLLEVFQGSVRSVGEMLPPRRRSFEAYCDYLCTFDDCLCTGVIPLRCGPIGCFQSFHPFGW